jgi:chemotaxis protein MotB
VTQVRGYADQFLRVKNNPYDPSNRRISILVKNGSDGVPPPDLNGVKVVGGEPKAAPATQTANKPPAVPVPAAQLKASAAATPASAGLMGKLKGMLPGTKK